MVVGIAAAVVVLLVVVIVVARSRRRGTSAPVAEPSAFAPVHHSPESTLGHLPHPSPVERAAPIPPLSSAAGTSALDASAHHRDAAGDTAQADHTLDLVGAGDGTQARPGWYPDPAFEADHRWWDGTKWTEHLS